MTNVFFFRRPEPLPRERRALSLSLSLSNNREEAKGWREALV